MSDLMDRIIADLVEGARRSEGFIRGGRANVEVARENRGRETKLAAFDDAPLGIKAAIFSMTDPSVAAARLVHGTEAPIKKPAASPAKPPPTPPLRKAAADGAAAAMATFQIKEAILPLVGALLGGTALRAGAGALARGVGGKTLGNIAGKALPKMTGGIGGAATDMVGSMAGGALGQKMMPQQQQPQPGM